MQIEFNKSDLAKLKMVVDNFPENYKRAVGIALTRIGQDLRKDAGDFAPFQTGNLRRSITYQVFPDKVVVGTNLIYARIHDEGGIIKPRTAKFLQFKVNGRWVRTKQVRIPKYKGRGYLTPAFQKQVKGEALKTFKEEIEVIL